MFMTHLEYKNNATESNIDFNGGGVVMVMKKDHKIINKRLVRSEMMCALRTDSEYWNTEPAEAILYASNIGKGHVR